MPPFKILYSRDPPTLTRPVYNTSDPPEVIAQLNNREALLQHAQGTTENETAGWQETIGCGIGRGRYGVA